MKDPRNREMMSKLYRMIEKYETPPKTSGTDEQQEYFSEAMADCQELYSEFEGNAFAECLIAAVYDAIGKRWKAVNVQPEQVKMEV